LFSEKRQPTAAEFLMDAFTAISFTHHTEILSKTSSLKEHLFYIRECASGHWSKTVLRARLKEDLYTIRGLRSHFVPAALRAARPCSDTDSPQDCQALSGSNPP
jgi:hypothetical protein